MVSVLLLGSDGGEGATSHGVEIGMRGPLHMVLG